MMESEAVAILHGYFRSSASFRVRIALNLKGVSYDQVSHHLRRGEQRRPEYLELNPQGLVPALEIDGVLLTQSLAIIEYLEERYPSPSLLPADPVGRARARAIAQLVACDVHPLNNLRVLLYLGDELGLSEESVHGWYAHWVRTGFAVLETMLRARPKQHPYCCGDRPTIADICLVPQVTNANNFSIDLSPFPTVERIAATALALPAFEAAHPQNQKDAE
jgi:maleylacetoacetate isomerase